MGTTGTKASQAFITWLESKAKAVKDLETKAAKALHEKQDQARYKHLMLEKTTLLAQLAEEAAPLVAQLPEPERGPISDRLSRFSNSASTAKRIGSVFYMSALLYPDDHVAGQMNDLEAFIASLRPSQD